MPGTVLHVVSITLTATMLDHHHMDNIQIHTTNPYPFSELHFQLSTGYIININGDVIYQGLL